MLEELVSNESKVIFYKCLFQPGEYGMEKNKVCSCHLHKVISDSEITVIDDSEDSDGRTLLKKHECYILDIYNLNKVYRCNAYYISSSSGDGYCYYTARIVSPVQKVQRRRYQRYPCHSLFAYTVLEKTQVHDIINKEWEDVKKSLSGIKGFKQEALSDISGGGLRFTSHQMIGKGEFLFCFLNFGGYNSKKAFPVICEVVYSGEMANIKDIFDIRLKYVGITEQQREQIINFGFWLERQRI